MDIIIIICLIAGVACVGVSFFIKEGTGVDGQEKEKIAEEIRSKALSDESLKKVIAKVEKDFREKLTGIAEDSLEGSSDKLSEVTNNKMLAINEMSGQLIEKIEQNHKEVIFLYDMLNEKSDNLKDFSAKIDGLRKELENEEKRIKALNNDLDDKIIKLKEVRQTVITKQARQVAEHGGVKAVSAEQIKKTVSESDKLPNSVPTQAEALVKIQQKQVAETKQNQSAEQLVEKNSQTAVSKQLQASNNEMEVKKTEELSVNDKILKMKEEGKSVIEISKTLGMGQGEVQLVLGLFGK